MWSSYLSHWKNLMWLERIPGGHVLKIAAKQTRNLNSTYLRNMECPMDLIQWDFSIDLQKENHM